MQDKSFTRTIDRVSQEIWTYIPSGAVTKFTPIRSPVTCGRFTLSNVSSSKGNFRDPLPQTYDIYDFADFQGSFYQRTTDGQWIYETFKSGNNASGSAGLMNQPFQDINFCYNRALADLNDRVRGSVDLSVDAFQAKQTARMFNASDQLVSLFSKKAGLIKKAGSTWLQYVYGWRPLMSSIYGSIDQLTNYELNKSQLVVGKSKTSETLNLRSPNPAGGYSTAVVDLSTVVQFGVRFRNVGTPSIENFTSLNPVSIAWELLPYSFVIDWFYDIGGYLRSVESSLLSRRNFVSGYQTTVRRLVAKSHDFYDGPIPGTSGPNNYRSFDLTSSLKKVSKSRVILSTIPLPRPPSLNLSLGSGRMLNAAALLSQALGVKPRA